MAVDWDVIVIGGGTAGRTAARAAAEEGARVLVIDDGSGSTTCASVGCMPSKALIASAHAAHVSASSTALGVVGEARVDEEVVFERIRRLRKHFVTPLPEALPASVTLRKGRAALVGEARVKVDDDVLEAGAVVLAAAGTARVLEPYRDLPNVWTYEDVFDLQELPERVGVVGGGAIGLELGQTLARLGVQVTLFEVEDRLGIFAEPEHDELVKEWLARDLTLHVGVDVEPGQGDGCLTLTHGERRIDVDGILLAVGRSRCQLGIESIGLDEVSMDHVDAGTMQLGDGPHFVAGDLIPPAVLHEAAWEGRVAGRNAARWPDMEAAERAVPLRIVFTDPQLVVVGSAREGLRYGEARYTDQGRARCDGEPVGFVRVGADDEGVIRHAELAVRGAEHLGHALAWVMARGVTVEELLEGPFYHPTIEEGLRTALRNVGH